MRVKKPLLSFLAFLMVATLAVSACSPSGNTSLTTKATFIFTRNLIPSILLHQYVFLPNHSTTLELLGLGF